MKKIVFCFCLLSSLISHASYPKKWWKKIPETQRKGWEILPQDAGAGEVVLSKRTELGVFSNLSFSPFVLDGKKYASIEGLWQSLKYPEINNVKDLRNHFEGWPFSRNEVKTLSGFQSKRAGQKANKIMMANNFKLVSYNSDFFNYRDLESGSVKHYKLIYSAIFQKVIQNKEIKALLEKTKGLRLIADHEIPKDSPKSYFYTEILMDIRDNKI